MIARCTSGDFEAIYEIINDAATAYRGVIPEDRYHEPYMSREELAAEMARGVQFWGFWDGGGLVGVIGVQDVKDVTLIRHAYVRTGRRRGGIGGQLLTHLQARTVRPVLVGTWADASWAIAFYERHGFRQVEPAEKDRLLKVYWTIPERQAETSVVLSDRRWLDGQGKLGRLAVGGTEVAYELVGEGIPVVTLHGYGVDHRIMRGCLEPVFARHPGYRRLYFDLPGMGRTPRSETVGTSDDMLELVEEVIRRTIGEEPYLLAGESYGGYLARGLVRRRPESVRGLLLICPVVVAERARRRLPAHVTMASDPAALEGLTPEERKEFESVAVIVNRRTWERTREDVMGGVALADTEFLDALRSRTYAFSFDPDALPTPFARPTLILTGRQDASVGYLDAWSLLDVYPHAAFAALDRAGHNLQLEQEGLFTALVEEWLARCAS